MNTLFVLAGPALMILVVALAGCDEEDSGQAERQKLLQQVSQARREAELARQQAADAQRRREQDSRVGQTREAEAEADTKAVVVLWIGSTAGLLAVMWLLVRERRARAVLHRLVRHLLGDRTEAEP